MSLRIRRGTDSQRQGITFDLGELVYTTDTKKLFVGDGVTSGGSNMLESTAGIGLSWNLTTQQLDVDGTDLTTSNITEGSNLYFTTERAQDASAILLTHNTGHTGISFLYDDTVGKIYATVTGSQTTLLDDLSPTLGGNLVLNTHAITGTGGINITGNITATSISTSLGANLGLNSHNITGTGDINITGSVTSSAGFNTTAIGIADSTISCNSGTLNIRGDVGFGSQITLHVLAASTIGGDVMTAANSFQRLDIRSVNGSHLSPSDIQTGDLLSGIGFAAYQSSTATENFGMIAVQADPAGTLTSTHVPTKFIIANSPSVTGGSLKFLTFDSLGRLAINQQNASATLDINGFAKLAILTAAPGSPSNGMIAIADGMTWNPLSNGKQSMVVYLGGGWRQIAAAP